MITYDDPNQLRAALLASPLYFTQYFFKIKTGRDFRISQPVSRESHYISISRALLEVFNGDITKLAINIPPRYAKTTLVIYFVCWALARYPDSNFLYISYSSETSIKQTQLIREIISLKSYKDIFGIEIDSSTRAKDNFRTNAGGWIMAFGAGGGITGHGFGIKGVLDRFGGCGIIDDIHKPDEVASDNAREHINRWWYETLASRGNNGPLTPMIFIGQRLHEDDQFNKLQENEKDWTFLSIPGLDVHLNALDPSIHTTEQLLRMKEIMPYVFAAQIQQQPTPAGGAVFKPDWFYLIDNEPKYEITFITADTAESIKDHADHTVFSLWGMYKIENSGNPTQEYALHWIDCWCERIEPKDLKAAFMDFYSKACFGGNIPKFAAIEKKSTGATLVSVLEEVRGLREIAIERTVASRSKATRYLEMQPYIAQKFISLPRYGRHTNQVIEHMSKITLNDSHRYDDICDTAYDAIKLAFIDKQVMCHMSSVTDEKDKVANKILGAHQRLMAVKSRGYRR